MFLCLSNYCFFDVFVAVTVVVANLGYIYRCKITEVAKYSENMTLGKCGGVSIARRVKNKYVVTVIKLMSINHLKRF